LLSFRTYPLKRLQQRDLDYHPLGMQAEHRSWSSGDGYRFGFNGKEQDNEVKGEGNSYDFGARIYDSRLSRWMSLDPLQIKYPSLSPYNFVANSPILFVDPDGRIIEIYYTTTTKDADGDEVTINMCFQYEPGIDVPDNDFLKETVQSIEYLSKSKNGKKLVEQAIDANEVVKINYMEGGAVYSPALQDENGNFVIDADGNYSESDNSIGYDPKSGLELSDHKYTDTKTHPKTGTGRIQSPALGLGHELVHFIHDIRNARALERRKANTNVAPKYTNAEERKTVRREKRIARQLGEPIRRSHRGLTKVVKGPTDFSTKRTRSKKNNRRARKEPKQR
jgi:RHS repeat-associated protein